MKKHIAKIHHRIASHSQRIPVLGAVVLAAVLLYGVMVPLFAGPRGNQLLLSSAGIIGEEERVLALLMNREVAVPGQDGVRARLTHGMAELPDGGSITLLPNYGFVRAGNGESIFGVVFVVSGGGSGSFYHLSLVRVNGDVVTELGQAFLGDRITVNEIQVFTHGDDGQTYRVVADILLRADDAPMSGPNTEKWIRTFMYMQGDFFPIDGERGVFGGSVPDEVSELM